jgi:hypothetical protein
VTPFYILGGAAVGFVYVLAWALCRMAAAGDARVDAEPECWCVQPSHIVDGTHCGDCGKRLGVRA